MGTQTFIYCSILAIITTFLVSAHSQDLTVKLIHRDSPHSPLYNPLHNASDRLKAAFLRSLSRSRHFSTKTDLQPGFTGNDGEYFMTISIGTPPTKLLAVADTGSDLSWVQCQPCDRCYKQNIPIFDRRNSSTYKTEPCEDSKPCNALTQD